MRLNYQNSIEFVDGMRQDEKVVDGSDFRTRLAGTHTFE